MVRQTAPRPDAISPSGFARKPTVLMVGKRWELVTPSISVLSGRGEADFRGPVDSNGQDSDAHLILVAPGTMGLGDLKRNRDDGASIPMLLCVPWQALESEDTYAEADDFVAVPCSAAELAKRIARLAGRQGRQGLPSEDKGLRVGGITLNTETYEVTVAGSSVSLAWMEFQLLRFLVENAGRVYRREEILHHVWGTDYIGGLRTVDVHIRRLRNKLGREGERWLRTVRNVGYGLDREG